MTFKEGDIVRVKATGFTGELDEINPNENFAVEDEYWALVRDDNFRSKELDGPDEIELVMSADDAAKRTLPTAREILNAIDFLSSWSGDRVHLDESSAEDEDAVQVFGQTDDGIRFSAQISVDWVERTDW